jgi:predicted permease
MILGDLGQDLRYAARSFRRSPGFTALVVLSLGLGIGANAAIFSLLDAVLLRAVPVPEPDSLVIFAQGRGRTEAPMRGRVDLVPHELYQRLRSDGAFSGVAAQDSAATSAVVHWRGEPDSTESNHALRTWVSGNYFDVLRLHALLGRTLQPTDDLPGAAPVVAISHRYWTRRHGADPAIVGARVSVNGRPHTVVGVMPPGFTGLDMRMLTDLWVPIASMQSDFNSDRAVLVDKRETRWLLPLGRLAPGVTRDAAQAGVNLTLAQYLADDPRLATKVEERRSTRFRLDPGAQGISIFRQSFRRPLLILMGGVGLLLLIVYLNIAHLLLARTVARQREMSVRTAVGASRARLVRQLLTEGLLLSLLGAGVGLGMMRWMSDGLVRLATSASRFVVVDVRLDGRVLAFTAVLALVSAALLGLLPARQVTGLDVQQTLRATSAGAGGARRLGSQLLLASQVAFSLVLLVGTGLLAGTLRNLRGIERGVDQEHVLVMWVSTEFSGLEQPRTLALQDEILRRVRALPGVREASLSFAADALLGGGIHQTITLPDGVPHRAPFAAVTPSYFETVGLRLLAGRPFTTDDRAGGPPVAIINQALARELFGAENPVGQRFVQASDALSRRMDSRSVEVVGMLRDAGTTDLRGESQPMAYTPAAQSPNFVGELEVRTAGDPGRLGEQIRRVVLEIQPGLPVRNIRSLQVELDRVLWRERLLAALSTGFGLTALFLVSLGLYGVISQWSGQRTREIGVRMALGATAGGVRWLVLRRALLLVLAGVAVGLPAAMAGAHLLQAMLFGIQPIDPITLGGAALILVTVTLVAAYLPARRASRIDPVAALRSE